MRDRKEIEKEMFAAREDLEINVAHLVHRARERAHVPARAEHAAREIARQHAGLLVALAAGFAAIVVGGFFLARAALR